MFSLSLMERLVGQISADKWAYMKHSGQSWREQRLCTVAQEWKASVTNETLAQV